MHEPVRRKKMLDILRKHDYTGYVGIEFEGSELGEEEGILSTKRLLEKYGQA